MRRVFQRVHGNISDTSWRQSELTFLKGRLGLTPLPPINIPAHTASLSDPCELKCPVMGSPLSIDSAAEPHYDPLAITLDFAQKAFLAKLMHNGHDDGTKRQLSQEWMANLWCNGPANHRTETNTNKKV